jgi:hypothetical protein
MINASSTRAPPVGRGCAILGGGIFDRNYGEFSTGVDIVFIRINIKRWCYTGKHRKNVTFGPTTVIA